MNAQYSLNGTPDLRLGDGTFTGLVRHQSKCKSRYWGQKDITWYSFRHSGISFAVERGVQLITLVILRVLKQELELVYYHHEEESRKTWEAINQNRVFFDRLKNENKDLIDYDNLLDGVETA